VKKLRTSLAPLWAVSNPLSNVVEPNSSRRRSLRDPDRERRNRRIAASLCGPINRRDWDGLRELISADARLLS